MSTNTDHNSICSVTKLAKKLGLSRARFYQLQKTGVFPAPVYCLYTKRPFYTTGVQKKCLRIRNTGIDCNGRPIIFNSKRHGGSAKLKNCLEQKHKELSEALKQIGLKVSPTEIRQATTSLYPNDWKKLDIDGEVIAKVFRYFKKGV